MKKQKILWAVDPFEHDLKLDHPTLSEFGQWLQESDQTIEPVYVLNSSQSEVTEVAQIEARIEDFFTTLGLKIEKPVILINQTRSVSRSAQCVVNHAIKSDAQMIVASSHGRSGMQRMRFGSFVEALLLESPVPLFIMNRKSRPEGASLKRAFWATNFSKHCEAAFNAYLVQAKKLTTDLLLFHDVSFPLEMMAYSGLSIPTGGDVVEDQKKWAIGECRRWLANASHHGINGKGLVAVRHNDIKESILKTARDKDAGLIVMASQAGPASSLLFGSEAYRVFRSGEFPVWIYGPRFNEKSAM